MLKKTQKEKNTCINAAGYTTGWMNYANEPSQTAFERSSRDVYDVIA